MEKKKNSKVSPKHHEFQQHMSSTLARYQKMLMLLVIFLIYPNMLKSQDAWKTLNTSSSPWSISPHLTCNQNTKYKVDIINMNYPLDKNIKNGAYGAATVWIDTWMYDGLPMDISFTVRNLSSPLTPIYLYTSLDSKKRFDDDRVWFVEIDYQIKNEYRYLKLYYSASKNTASNSIYQSYCTDDNGTQSKWEWITSLDYRQFRILFDGNQIKIYDKNGENLVKIIYGVIELKYIRVGVGSGTNLEITNTSYKMITTYGQALPYIHRAADYIKRNYPYSAAIEMTTAIDNKGFKFYETYLYRGIAQYMQGNYELAIEDLTTAISYTADNKEIAYYYRGMSKLAINDNSGIGDLKHGGQDGVAFLQERNRSNYPPRTTNQSKPKAVKKSTSVPPKKPALTK
ncbi:MAG: hypothetical protein J1F40_04235 [Prevotellaceae bacterium]|nr:hypothetical protein [Prevotellaceae bacterium]